MFRYLLFAFLLSFLSVQALEIEILGGKEKHQFYSTLHIKNPEKFICQEFKNNFDVVTEIACAFSKQPQEKIKPIQNDFFNIISKTKDKTFFLIIKPRYKIKLYPMIFDLTKDEAVFKANAKMANHWMVVGYKDKIPYLKEMKQNDMAIDFPFLLDEDMLPYVGGLDIKGNPVYIKKVQDVTDYVKIKKFYRLKMYEQCLDLIDVVMQKYPDTLFKAEFIYYKIKSYIKLKDYDNAIENAKIYLKNYSSDENIAEVISLIAYAYAKVGMNTDADYFFDRLFSEHTHSKAAEWGYIYKGEMLEDNGASSKAATFYEKALDETDDLEIASAAAYKLVELYRNNGKYKKASIYVKKILKANPKFFKEDFATSMDMMYGFAQNNYFAIASDIAKSLLDGIDRTNDEYEDLMKNRALWLCKTDKKQEAIKALDAYLDEFKYGEYVDDIKEAKDKLFFDIPDNNVTKQLAKYDELIVKYKGDAIGDKALYEKAKLLLKQKMYSDVLGLKESLSKLDKQTYKDVDEIIKQSAIGVMKNALAIQECNDVLRLSKKYNIKLSNKWDDGLYKCFMKGADFISAKAIAKRHLNSKDLAKRKLWLYRYIKVDFSTSNYSDVLDASKELISLIEDDKNSPYRDIYRILFDTYERLEKKQKMIEAMAKIQEVFGRSYKDIDRYASVMAIGSELRDDNLIIKYAKEIRAIQLSSKSYPQSPFVEFTLYQAYVDKQDYQKALEVIKFLDNIELTPSQRARQKYLLGSIYQKLWREDEAKKAYEASIKADSKSPWAKLSKSAKEF